MRSYIFGQNVLLRCTVALGGSNYNFSWEAPDGSTNQERWSILTDPNLSQLSFQARQEDDGSYTCEADDGTFSGTDTAIITIGNISTYYLLTSYWYLLVPAILMGPEDMILEYSDVLTATFTCTAFGGNDAELLFNWNPTAGFNDDSLKQMINPNDNSTTSTITTDPLTLSDRGETYSCNVEYDLNQRNAEAATLAIGENLLV